VPQFAVRDRVSQATYGTGTVTAVNEYHTTIDFDEHGLRTFNTMMVQLAASDTLAPEKPAKRTRKKAAPKAAAKTADATP
jgi:hypothetical protein